MKQRAAIVLSVVSVFVFGLGCQSEEPAPVRCVCNCDGPLPEGAVVTASGEEKSSEVVSANKATPAPVAVPTPAPAAQPAPPSRRPVAEAPGRRPAPPNLQPPPSQRAKGRISAEPGSGVPVTFEAKDSGELIAVFTGFAKAAGDRDLVEMQKWTTQRLGASLQSALEGPNRERLFRRTDMFAEGVQSGVTVGQITRVGDGNHSVEFKLGNGKVFNLMVFKEDENWRLNRL